MIRTEIIEELATGFLEKTDKYLVGITVKPGNLIIITIDGDSNVKIEDCIILSKFIESNLDRDSEDFELRVTSYGADSPLKLKRQYIKNIGRNLLVTTTSNSKEKGRLTEVNDDSIVIAAEMKKKTEKEESFKTLRFDEINEAKVILSFK